VITGPSSAQAEDEERGRGQYFSLQLGKKAETNRYTYHRNNGVRIQEVGKIMEKFSPYRKHRRGEERVRPQRPTNL